jgi:hypothetical protein
MNPWVVLMIAMGGVFSLLVFWHFLADWVFQSQTEAMTKAKDRKVRLWHCTKYAAAFVPLLFVTTNWAVMLMSLGILFVSHYFIDSYVPVMLWAKHLRKAVQFECVGKRYPPQPWQDKVVEPRGFDNDEEAFKAFAATPLGLILIITMDQFFHIAFLLPVAFLMVWS